VPIHRKIGLQSEHDATVVAKERRESAPVVRNAVCFPAACPKAIGAVHRRVLRQIPQRRKIVARRRPRFTQRRIAPDGVMSAHQPKCGVRGQPPKARLPSPHKRGSG
jgi:hypothetical protein